MTRSGLIRLAVAILAWPCSALFAQTDLMVNGSFESGLSSWLQGAVTEAGQTGTCSYNAATAPGTETLTSTAGFPATNGTGIALGSVSATTSSGSRTNCVLYQDVPIPAGTGTLTLKFDLAVKAGNDGCSHAGLFVGLYATSAIPGLSSSTLGGASTSICTAASPPSTVLATFTVPKTAAAVAGTTVRVAFINAANTNGHEVVGVDNVQLIATPAPTVTSVSPNSGPTAGGTSVTITGTNFTGATGVTVGGAAATSVSVVNATSITATVPSHAAGSASVIVTTPAGSNAANTLYTYIAPPTVTSVSPNSGPTAGGTSVTITGTTFTGATSVTFGGAAATSFSVVNATSITATVPAGAAGAVSVVVTTPAGSNAANALYTYISGPTVTSVNPSSGSTAGGTVVTITGTTFTGATSITFGGVAATSFAIVNATTITATVPAGAAGSASVIVTTPSGSNAANTLYT